MPSNTFSASSRFSGTVSTKVANDSVDLNKQSILQSYTFPANWNGVTAGPVTIADGVTITITDGCSWSIV